MTTRNLPTTTQGFTLLEIMTVVALIGLLAAMAIPYVLKPRTTTQTTVCIKYLRLIEDGKEQLAFEYRIPNGASVIEDSVNTYLKTGRAPECPAGGVYSYNPLGSNPTCNITDHVLPD